MPGILVLIHILHVLNCSRDVFIDIFAHTLVLILEQSLSICSVQSIMSLLDFSCLDMRFPSHTSSHVMTRLIAIETDWLSLRWVRNRTRRMILLIQHEVMGILQHNLHLVFGIPHIAHEPLVSILILVELLIQHRVKVLQ